MSMDFQEQLSNDIDKIPYSESLTEFETEYKCLRLIGEGGFGKVRKAMQLSDDRNVAIKYIADKKITSWHFCKKQHNIIPMEIALMCRCHKVPGVMKIIKYFKIKEHSGWYIVMERFNKFVDLFDYITKEGHLDEKLAAHFMRQLLKIVLRCHKLGVCHRDIKDENIVIDLETMKIYLIDFGAGGILHSGIYTEFDGTRVYSPPEWITVKQYHALSLEVWSLGILLFDMVCGNLPFDSDESISRCIFSYRRSVSRTCQDLIERCLQNKPTKRIDIKDILHHPWFIQQSSSNTMERPKICPWTQFSSPSVNIDYSSSESCHNSPDNDSGRHSLDTSPFSSPQSSGLEDSDQLSDNTHSYNTIPCNTSYLSQPKRHDNINCDISLTNFRNV